jgi:hypothetical protein
MLPGWLVATSTIRMAESRSEYDGIEGARITGAQPASPPTVTMGAFVLVPRPPAPQADRRNNPTMHPMLTIAVKAARRAGSIINRGAREIDLLTVTSKGPKDFVSEVDREAERPSSKSCSRGIRTTRF